MTQHHGKLKLDKQMRCQSTENTIFHFTRFYSTGERSFKQEGGTDEKIEGEMDRGKTGKR